MKNLIDYQTPNVRKLFKPDPGYILFDVDLAGADAQIVAWEAGDAPLKKAFRDYAAGVGEKVHCINAKTIFGGKAGPKGTIDPYYTRAKMGVHLTNYGGTERTCAAALKITIREAEEFQRIWFREHPDIKRWQDSIWRALQTTRSVTNPFGFTRHYFDRIERSLLNEALAWIPQSTVAIVINKAWINIDNNVPDAEILLQVHDSLVGQVPIKLWPMVKPELLKNLLIPIPYDDPLTIPVGLKTSAVSWGDCEDEDWDK